MRSTTTRTLGSRITTTTTTRGQTVVVSVDQQVLAPDHHHGVIRLAASDSRSRIVVRAAAGHLHPGKSCLITTLVT